MVRRGIQLQPIYHTHFYITSASNYDSRVSLKKSPKKIKFLENPTKFEKILPLKFTFVRLSIIPIFSIVDFFFNYFSLIQTFGLVGLLAVNIARVYVPQYNSAAGTAFVVTLILLLLLVCKSSLRQSSIFQKVELVICIILTIFYVVGSIDIIRACWFWLFDNFRLGPFIGSLIASVSNLNSNSLYSFSYFNSIFVN